MSPLARRRLLSTVIDSGVVFAALALLGWSWWAVVLPVYGLWCYYDGLTRGDL